MSFNINHIFYSPVIQGPTDPITPADPEEPVTPETENNEKNKSSKNLITVLKDFLSKLTGTTIKGKNLVEVIDNGSNALDETGGNAKSNLFFVRAEYSDSDGKYHVTTSLEEIKEAFEAGKQIYADIDGDYYIPLTFLGFISEEIVECKFASATYDGGISGVQQLMYTAGEWNFYEI